MIINLLAIGPFKPIPNDMSDFPTHPVVVAGPSGYIEPNHIHVETAHWDAERGGWLSDSNDRLNEGWPEPTHYAEFVEGE